MKRKIRIILSLSIIMLIIQTIIPLKTSICVDTYKIDSNSARIASKNTGNTLFDDNVTFKWSYPRKSEANNKMQYGLYAPSDADNFGNLPLIVWLHGRGTSRPK